MARRIRLKEGRQRTEDRMRLGLTTVSMRIPSMALNMNPSTDSERDSRLLAEMPSTKSALFLMVTLHLTMKLQSLQRTQPTEKMLRVTTISDRSDQFQIPKIALLMRKNFLEYFHFQRTKFKRKVLRRDFCKDFDFVSLTNNQSINQSLARSLVAELIFDLLDSLHLLQKIQKMHSFSGSITAFNH
jgi:hypothetical protein